MWNIMLYYSLFWTRSPYLDLQWRSRSTGNILELLITSIVRHKNKNRWVGDPLCRSCSLFCVVIFQSSFGLVKYPYTKQFTWESPPSPVLVILPYIYGSNWWYQLSVYHILNLHNCSTNFLAKCNWHDPWIFIF